jgi:hypothetical protein
MPTSHVCATNHRRSVEFLRRESPCGIERVRNAPDYCFFGVGADNNSTNIL